MSFIERLVRWAIEHLLEVFTAIGIAFALGLGSVMAGYISLGVFVGGTIALCVLLLILLVAYSVIPIVVELGEELPNEVHEGEYDSYM